MKTASLASATSLTNGLNASPDRQFAMKPATLLYPTGRRRELSISSASRALDAQRTVPKLQPCGIEWACRTLVAPKMQKRRTIKYAPFTKIQGLAPVISFELPLRISCDSSQGVGYHRSLLLISYLHCFLNPLFNVLRPLGLIYNFHLFPHSFPLVLQPCTNNVYLILKRNQTTLLPYSHPYYPHRPTARQYLP
jgi:hypothetical protein